MRTCSEESKKLERCATTWQPRPLKEMEAGVGIEPAYTAFLLYSSSLDNEQNAVAYAFLS
jgi:hypothetical protein